MTAQDDTTPGTDIPDTQADPQSHLDRDPSNDPATAVDSADDPAHDTGEDEGWASEGGSTPDGPATDT